MPPRYIEIEGKKYLWREIVNLRREQIKAAARPEQPTLFELREDHRPPGERTAAERYEAPSLFSILEPKPLDIK
jgi:hypothetical protein